MVGVDHSLIAVLGGTGFIGSHVVSKLVEQGARVRTFSRGGPTTDGIEHVAGDLRERVELRRAVAGADRVFHFGSSALPSTSNEDPRRDVEETVVGGIDVLNACVAAGVKTVLFPSSGGTVYGPVSSGSLDEKRATEPISSYGITKLAFEKYLALFRELHGLDYRILRVSNAYGEGQPGYRPQGLVGAALQRVADREPMTIWGDGSTVRDYVYVGDVADSFVAALRPLEAGAPRIFNVGTGTGHSVREVLAVVEKVTGQTLGVTYEPQRTCDADRVVLDNRRVRDVLGWSPKVDLEDGVERMWAWLRTQRGAA